MPQYRVREKELLYENHGGEFIHQTTLLKTKFEIWQHNFLFGYWAHCILKTLFSMSLLIITT